jgi:DNA-binding NarL/FixJ family response regulator
MTVTVAVADDQELVRVGFRKLLETEDGIDVVGEAADGIEAVGLAKRLRPDVMLMDIRMPNLDGLEATRQLTSQTDTQVLILTTYDLDEYVFEALRAGASGFLLKDCPAEMLIEGIFTVARGDALLAPSITRRLISEFAHRPAPDQPAGLPELTARETEVLSRMAHGESNREISQHLYLGEATIKTHVGNILMKLNCRDRVQAVVKAYEAGVVTPGTAEPKPAATHRHTSASHRMLATVLLTDIVASTELAGRLGDRQWTKLLDEHDRLVAREVTRHQGRIVKSTGDGVLARFDRPGNAIICAQAIHGAASAVGIQLRCGLHTGEIEVRGDDIGGIAVHIASRIAALAEPGSIWVSRTITELVAGSGIAFRPQGNHHLKGVPQPWSLYAVDTTPSPSPSTRT